MDVCFICPPLCRLSSCKTSKIQDMLDMAHRGVAMFALFSHKINGFGWISFSKSSKTQEMLDMAHRGDAHILQYFSWNQCLLCFLTKSVVLAEFPFPNQAKHKICLIWHSHRGDEHILQYFSWNRSLLCFLTKSMVSAEFPLLNHAKYQMWQHREITKSQ